MDMIKQGKRIIDNNFHALTHKNFRSFWLGQCVSLIGTWIQNVGQSWLVLSITGSPFLLGLVNTIQFLPVMLFSLFAGTVVDRFPKKKILICTQSCAMILAFILSALVFTHKVQYWHVIILAALLGVSNTLDMPTRQSFTVEIVGKEDLRNAIGLNSTTFNLARILGPGIGGMMMAYLGAGWCFLLNGLSFVAVIYSLVCLDSKPYVRKRNTEVSMFTEIYDGLKYIASSTLLMQTVLMVLIVGIFVFNFNILIPVFTKQVLYMGEKTYGFLLSSLGIGSFIGAVMVTMRSKRVPKKNTMVVSSVLISIMLILIGLSRSQYITVSILVITGICNIYFSTTANSILQIFSKDEYRGRVMSVYSLVFAGATPIGSLFAGYTAGKLGAASGFMLSGIFNLSCIALIAIVFLRKSNIINENQS